MTKCMESSVKMRDEYTYVSPIIPLETETWSIILTHCRWVQRTKLMTPLFENRCGSETTPLSPRWMNLVRENGVVATGPFVGDFCEKPAVGWNNVG